MKYIQCDHCKETYNPFTDGGLTITLGTSNGAMQLDFCRKHGEVVLQSLDKYTDGYISSIRKGNENQETTKEDNDV